MMLRMGKETRTIARRVFRALLLAQLLPTLLLTPSGAGAVLLHSHSDEAHHVHFLTDVELHRWTDSHAAAHDCATAETDGGCAASESPPAPDGVILQRPPMLVCRVRSADAAAVQPILHCSVSAVTAASTPAIMNAPEVPRDEGPPPRCLDTLLSGSHALLI